METQILTLLFDVAEFKGYMMGGITAAQWAAALFFALTGMTVSVGLDVSNRDREKASTPNKISFSYLIADNFGRFLLNVILIMIYLRFSPELLGVDLTMFIALLIGLVFDRLGMHLKKKNIIDKKSEPNPEVND